MAVVILILKFLLAKFGFTYQHFELLGVQISSRPFSMKIIIYLFKINEHVNRVNLHLLLCTSSTFQADSESPGGKTAAIFNR